MHAGSKSLADVSKVSFSINSARRRRQAWFPGRDLLHSFEKTSERPLHAQIDRGAPLANLGDDACTVLRPVRMEVLRKSSLILEPTMPDLERSEDPREVTGIISAPSEVFCALMKLRNRAA